MHRVFARIPAIFGRASDVSRDALHPLRCF
jgi:hypothetical protein